MAAPGTRSEAEYKSVSSLYETIVELNLILARNVRWKFLTEQEIESIQQAKELLRPVRNRLDVNR